MIWFNEWKSVIIPKIKIINPDILEIFIKFSSVIVLLQWERRYVVVNHSKAPPIKIPLLTIKGIYSLSESKSLKVVKITIMVKILEILARAIKKVVK